MLQLERIVSVQQTKTILSACSQALGIWAALRFYEARQAKQADLVDFGTSGKLLLAMAQGQVPEKLQPFHAIASLGSEFTVLFPAVLWLFGTGSWATRRMQKHLFEFCWRWPASYNKKRPGDLRNA